MKKKQVIIIGGDAAGLSAASSIRRSHEDWDIVVYEKGRYISYAACGIPYYVADLVQDESTMITITRETFLRKRNIPVKIFHEVLAVDTATKEVHVVNIETGEEFKDKYDILVIATGATPKLPSIPGIMHPRVFTVHGLDSGITIKQFIERNKPESVVLIGAGYINLEMVEACHAAGIHNITMIKRSPRVLPSFAEKISSLVKQELEKHGISLIHGNPVTRLDSRDDGGIDVILKDPELESGRGNNVIPADFVIVATGVEPNTGFLRNSGITLDEHGAVDVDRKMRTNIKNVHAAGDCANVFHVLTGEKIYNPLATMANKQGRYAGYAIGGRDEPFPGTMETIITRIMTLCVSRTGLSIEHAKSRGIDAVEVSITHKDRAHYYPGTRDMFMSIVVDRASHHVLGASIAGSELAAKKIDTWVALIKAGMPIEEIQMLDLSYAPPFSPVYDAISIVASVARKKI